MLQSSLRLALTSLQLSHCYPSSNTFALAIMQSTWTSKLVNLFNNSFAYGRQGKNLFIES